MLSGEREAIEKERWAEVNLCAAGFTGPAFDAQARLGRGARLTSDAGLGH